MSLNIGGIANVTQSWNKNNDSKINFTHMILPQEIV